MLDNSKLSVVRRVRRAVTKVYRTGKLMSKTSVIGAYVLDEDGCTTRDLRGELMEEAVRCCFEEATSQRIFRGDDDPTCVFDEDAAAMLLYVSLTHLIYVLGGEKSAKVLVKLAPCLRDETENLRETVLNIVDNAYHGYPLK
ncbi:hypothetical protein [Methylobacterium frigidaeris]|uniref:hypothetical protein n=1 Tax=Methylobacterium frigidaeris TaxID=2038277 RepID=UPI001EE02EE7|nr:hypothetical protein [Methylobacterium frigidaeris]